MATVLGQVGTPEPPFAEKDELLPQAALVLPVVFSEKFAKRELLHIGLTPDARTRWVSSDLNVKRLNQVHPHLWMAGLPQISRPLHDHARIGRNIILTEQADLHLVWTGDKLFLKPLPDYLLCYGIWKSFICPATEVSEDARGLLLSYIWLLSSRTDWRLACEKGLVSPFITWEQWTIFVGKVIDNIDYRSLFGINPRYLYGELRLSRLSLIYRFCSSTRTVTNLIRGYNYGYHDYSSFLERNFTWVLTAIVYVTVVLTAMQVGLATSYLVDSQTFQRAAYGFTVFSIVAPLVLFAAGLVVVVFLVAWNWSYTRQRALQALEEFGHLFSHSRVAHR